MNQKRPEVDSNREIKLRWNRADIADGQNVSIPLHDDYDQIMTCKNNDSWNDQRDGLPDSNSSTT